MGNEEKESELMRQSFVQHYQAGVRSGYKIGVADMAAWTYQIIANALISSENEELIKVCAEIRNLIKKVHIAAVKNGPFL